MSEMKTITYRKVCSCQGATASGPRLAIFQAEEETPGFYRFTAKVFDFACDVCDTPWEREVTTPFKIERVDRGGIADGVL